jgi:predicted Zn-dependent protease
LTSILLVTLALVSSGSLRAQDPGSPAPEVMKARAAEGERALAEGRYADAERAYMELRRLSPGTAEVHARLGLIYFQQGRHADAVPPLRKALELKPALPRLDVLLAMSLSELGQYEEALPGLTKGFGQQEDAVLRRMAGLHLQRAYTGLARDREAVGVALELSRLLPDDPEVLYHTGRLFANFAYLQTMKLAEVAPDSTWMHQAAGEANESQGLYEAALAEYRKVLAKAPKRPGVHFRIGRVLLAASRAGAGPAAAADEALQAFEAELRIDPTNANAAYEMGEQLRQQGDLPKAREYFERALTNYPDFENARVGLARTRLAMGDAARAAADLEEISRRNPANAVALYQLAQAYAALGRTAEQEGALAAFARLRAGRDTAAPTLPVPNPEVTPQELDPRDGR